MTKIIDYLLSKAKHSGSNYRSLAERLYDQGRQFEFTRNQPAKAAKYYRLAACEGHKPAQTALAMLYIRGSGVQENRALAIQWLEKAEQHKLIKLLQNY